VNRVLNFVTLYSPALIESYLATAIPKAKLSFNVYRQFHVKRGFAPCRIQVCGSSSGLSDSGIES
jgi:hypothetical protein